mgnify:CR=1 FL=1
MVRPEPSRRPIPKANQNQADASAAQSQSDAEPLQGTESPPMTRTDDVDSNQTCDADQADHEDDDTELPFSDHRGKTQSFIGVYRAQNEGDYRTGMRRCNFLHCNFLHCSPYW